MLKKLNKEEKIQVVFKLRNIYTDKLENTLIGEVESIDDAFDVMNKHIEQNSTIDRPPYIRYHLNKDILVIDYGAHNANYTFSNIQNSLSEN